MKARLQAWITAFVTAISTAPSRATTALKTLMPPISMKTWTPIDPHLIAYSYGGADGFGSLHLALDPDVRADHQRQYFRVRVFQEPVAP